MMSKLPKVKPESTLQMVRLDQHATGVNLVLGFNDGQFNLVELSNTLDRNEVSVLFKNLAVDVSLFEIH